MQSESSEPFKVWTKCQQRHRVRGDGREELGPVGIFHRFLVTAVRKLVVKKISNGPTCEKLIFNPQKFSLDPNTEIYKKIQFFISFSHNPSNQSHT